MKQMLTLLLLFSGIMQLTAKPAVLLNTSHKGTITQVLYDESSNIVFSSGSDGSIKAWDIRTKDLSKTILHTNLPIKKFLLNPSRPQIAVLESDNIRLHKITLWNWQTGKLIATFPLSAEPVSMGYSTAGNLFYINKVDIPSISIINAENGKELPYLQNITSVVSSSYIGSSERTIMTYSSTGLIQYWDIKTGTQKKLVKSIPDLQNWNVTSNLKFLTGTRGADLLVIDRLTGEVVSKTNLGNLNNSRIIYHKDDIALLRLNEKTTVLEHFTFKEDHFEKGFLAKELPVANLTSLTYGKGIVITGNQMGEIYYTFIRSKVLRPFALDIIEPINDLHIKNDVLYISTDNNLSILQSDFLVNQNTETLRRAQWKEIPLSNSYIITENQDTISLLPQKNGGPLLQLNGKNEAEEKENLYFEPTRNKSYKEGVILTLSESGQIQVYNNQWSELLFNYNYLGLMDTDFYMDDKIIGGHVAKRGSPLLFLNYITKESLPIDDEALLVYNLEGAADSIYALTLEEKENSTFTQLKQYTGNLLETSRVILEIEGEELNHDLLFDQDNLYTTLPDHQIHLYNKGRWKDFESNNNFIVNIYSYNDFIIGKNKDYGLSFWNKSNKKYLGDLYLLKDGLWVFISVEDEYYGSEGAGEFLSFFYN